MTNIMRTTGIRMLMSGICRAKVICVLWHVVKEKTKKQKQNKTKTKLAKIIVVGTMGHIKKIAY